MTWSHIMPKRTYSRRPRRTRKRYGGKRKKAFRKAGYRSRSQGRSVAKYTSIVRPITLKPKFQMRRLQFYNTCRIDCALVQSGQHADIIKSTVPLWFTLRLNSPYPVLHSNTPRLVPDPSVFQNSTIDGIPAFHWNTPMTQHNTQSAINEGSRYEGWDGPGSPAYGYAQYCVLGTKVTATYTPIGNVASSTGAVPTGFFGFLHTDADNQLQQAPRSDPLGPNHTWIKSIYQKPYSKVVKILPTQSLQGNTGTAHYGGGGTSGRLVFNYSPKRMNGIKDIADNATLWGALHNDGSPQWANHPAEGDYLTIGLAPLMADVNSTSSTHDPIAPMQSGMLQLKMETVIAFREPVNATAAAGSGNVGTGLGGGGGDLAAMAGSFVGGAARGFIG